MSIVRNLGSIIKHNEAEDAKFRGGSSDDAPKAVWFKLSPNQSVKLVFLQELDEDSPNYSKKNDLGFLAVEHVNPGKDMWRNKALCTMADEGACWACEQHDKDWKAGWKQKTKLYINVLIDEGNGKEPYVAVLSQGMGPKSITPTLIEYAGDDETITDKWFSTKRTGSGISDTSYTLRAGKAHDLNVEDYELFDLEKVLRKVPYAQQEAHYRRGEQGEVAEDGHASERAMATASTGGSTSTDNEW